MSRDHEAAGVGTAVLTGDAEGESDTFTIHGIAIGSGDVTVGSSGVKKVWPEDELQVAASTLEGKPLVKDHENNVDGVIGRVTKTKFKPGTGVLYEAEITEQFEDVAQKIADGLLEVSVRAFHAPTEELEDDEELEAKVVEDIVFDNMAVVPQGAAPSNTANAGAAATMSADRPDLSAAELQAEFEEVDTIGPSDVDELGLHAIKVFGHIGLNEDFLDENSVEDLVGDLQSHEALTVVFGEEEHDLLLVVDGSLVDSNDELDEHVVDNLDDTPWELWDDWSWLDNVDESLSPGRPEEDVVELAFHGPALDAIQTFAESDDGSMDSTIAEIREASTSDHLMDAIEAYLDAGGSDDDPVSDLESWIESDSDDDNMSGHTEEEESQEMPRYTHLDEWSEEELQELSVHEPDWSGTTTGSWSKPAMEDFDTDDLGDVDDHFLVSKNGFPPENFGDLALPVVHPNGDLNLSALQNAKSRAGQVSGLSGDALNRVENMIDRLANDNFEGADFGDEEESGSGTEPQTDADKLSNYMLARIADDSSEEDKLGTSDSDSNTNNDTMTQINYQEIDGDELEDGYVAVDRTELDAVVEKAERADELDDRLDDMNDTLSQLSERAEILDEVDEEDLQALRDREDPVVKEREAYEADMDMVSETGEVFAELLAEEDSIFTAEELMERNSPLELKTKYEELLGDDATLVDQLAAGDPTPEGEDVDSEELGDTGREADAEAKREAFRGRLADELESQGYPTQAEEVRSGDRSGMVDEYAEKLGADLE